jgi:hypothetical protein
LGVLLALDGDPDPAIGFRGVAVLDGVADQVDQGELDPGGIDLDVGDRLLDFDPDPLLGGEAVQLFHSLLEERAQRQAAALGGLLAPLGHGQSVHVVRHPLDPAQSVLEGAEGFVAGFGGEPVVGEELDGHLGGVQAVAQLVGEVAAEAAQEARPLPAVPEALFPESVGRDGGDRRQGAVEAFGHLDGVAGRHLPLEALSLLPQGAVEDVAQDFELGQDLVDVIALLAAQAGELGELVADDPLGGQVAAGAEVVRDGLQDLRDMVEQGLRGEDSPRVYVQPLKETVQPRAGELPGAAVELGPEVDFQGQDILSHKSHRHP